MKTNDSIAKATVSLFEDVDYAFLMNLKQARQIFVSDCKKSLERSYGYVLHDFYCHPSKICLAQN